MSLQVQNASQLFTLGNRRILVVIACILLASSPLWIFGAGALFQNARERLETWTPTQARVIELCADTDHDSSVYYPRFRFTAEDGKTYEVRGNFGSSDPEYRVGDMMPILYPEAEPSEAVEDSFMAHYLSSIVLGAFGLLDFFFGCLLLYLSRRKNLRSAPSAETC